MDPRARARLTLVRATEKALDRYPERTVAMVRANLERTARRHADRGLERRALLARLTVRAMDLHPVVAERMVRLWLRRASREHLPPEDLPAGRSALSVLARGRAAAAARPGRSPAGRDPRRPGSPRST